MRTNTRKFRLALTALTLVALLLGLGVGSVSADPGTVYVATDGTDGLGCGTAPENACQTIQYAIGNRAVAGNTISVAPGNYGGGIQVNKPNLTIKSSDGAAQTVIQFAPSGVASIISGIAVSTEGVTIQGFKITGFSCGILLDGPASADNCTIKNNIIENNGEGIWIWTDNNQILGNDILDNRWTTSGIHLTEGASGNVIHFNNIVGNSVEPLGSYVNSYAYVGHYGVYNANPTESVTATHNWWGDASGPKHGPFDAGTDTDCERPREGGWNCGVCNENLDGAGDKVSYSVDYCPWLEAGVEEVHSEPVSGTATITDTATGGDVTINATTGTTHTVTTAKYKSNPGGDHTFKSTGYYDVHLSDKTGVASLTIEFCPATEDTVIYYWNGTAWVACSNQVFNPGTGCVVVTITAATDPNLDYLTGGPFASGYTPAPVGGITLPSDPIRLLAPWLGLAALMVMGVAALVLDFLSFPTILMASEFRDELPRLIQEAGHEAVQIRHRTDG